MTQDAIEEQCPVPQTNLFVFMCGFTVDVVLYLLWYHSMKFVVEELRAQHYMRTRPVLEYEDDIEDGNEDKSVAVTPPTEALSESAATEAEATTTDIEEPPDIEETTPTEGQLTQRSVFVATVRDVVPALHQANDDIPGLMAEFVPFKDRVDHVPSPKKLKVMRRIAFIAGVILCILFVLQTYVDWLRLKEYIDLDSNVVTNYFCATRVVYESSNTRRMLPIIYTLGYSGVTRLSDFDIWAHGPLVVGTMVSLPVMMYHVPMLPVLVMSIPIGFPVLLIMSQALVVYQICFVLLTGGLRRGPDPTLTRTMKALYYFCCIFYASWVMFMCVLWVTCVVQMMVMVIGSGKWENSLGIYHVVSFERTDGAYFTQERSFREQVAFWTSFM